ncbi:MAG TPA: hypothetical protein V6D05_04410 [Stenomitos sp.]
MATELTAKSEPCEESGEDLIAIAHAYLDYVARLKNAAEQQMVG